jgi:hypothetical protein
MMHNQISRRFVMTATALLLVVLSMTTVVIGQATSGDLVGTVSDQSGAVVPAAPVTATNLETGQTSTVTADGNGQFRFVNLPVGHYKLETSSSGLTGGHNDVPVQLNKTITQNIVLTPKSADTSVEVTAAATTVDTTTANIQTSFESQQVQELPTASTGLGVLNLSLLNAGVATSGGIGAGTGPSVSGQRPRNNNYTVEGVDNNSKAVTGPLVVIPNDAVEDFTVLQNQFSPEFGHSSGGQFNQVVKSGTNKFHGRAYEYFQNRNLNAQDSFVSNSLRSQGLNPSNPPLDNNRYGGQFGGPIIKDKLFFFSNHEYNPIRTSVSSSACAPTAAGFALLANQANSGQISANNFGVLQKFLTPAPAQASSAADPCLINGNPFISVNGADVPIGSVGFTGSQYNNTYTTVNSVDWNLSASDQLRVRYIYSKNNLFDAAAQLSTFWAASPTRNHVVTVSEYHSLSPRASNELRLGYNRLAQDVPITNAAFPGLKQFPNITIDELNNVNIGPDSVAPQFTFQNTYQLTDNLTWTRGNHTFKFGFEARKYISPTHFVQRERGDYLWASTEDFLNDIAPTDSGERSTSGANYIADQYALYGYANDTWKINSHLTLTAGLRYEFTSNSQGITNQKLNAAASVPGVLTFGEPKTQKKNFAPRIGIAYSPGNSGATSIRAGFGIAYDVLYDNIGTLSLPPQLTGTCDVGDPQSAACFYSNTGFLAAGGLPQTGNTSFPTVADQRQATAAFVPDQKLPYTESWNVGIQHVFAKKYIAEVRYVGTHGLNLPIQSRINRQSKVSGTSFLPTFLQAPTQTQLDALTTTLDDLNAKSNFTSAFDAAGFNGSNITAFTPAGHSMYHGLQTQLTRNYSNGLQLQAAWTWSHAFDNSTADVFSTLLTPRRPQDFQNVDSDYSTSALDRRHRLTIAAVYDLPFFRSGNAFARNVLGNWGVAPAYTFQSPEYVTVQSAVDSNLNGDSFGDRAIFNPNGVAGTGSGVTELTNSSGAVVAYLANNPNAQYIAAGAGALATSPRNSLALPHTNNWDMSLVKKLSFKERYSLELQAQALNVFNHSQFVAGTLNTVNAIGYTSGNIRDFLTPGKAIFNRPDQVFSQNGRTMSLVLKFSF